MSLRLSLLRRCSHVSTCSLLQRSQCNFHFRHIPATHQTRSESTTPHHHHNQSPVLSTSFWVQRSAWRRASINTFRCLVGCTTGDFSSMWLLQTYYPDLGVGAIMGASMIAGISTSLLLETLFLRFGKDKLTLKQAVRTAAGMSMVSMISMEAVENAVDYSMTGGVVDVADPMFWVSAGVSMGAGFLAPLPYNYFMLKRYGKACH